MVSQEIVYKMVDGPSSALALKLVVVGLRAELVATLHLQMVARIVLVVQATRATHKLAQVQFVSVDE